MAAGLPYARAGAGELPASAEDTFLIQELVKEFRTFIFSLLRNGRLGSLSRHLLRRQYDAGIRGPVLVAACIGRFEQQFPVRE